MDHLPAQTMNVEQDILVNFVYNMEITNYV